MKRLIASLMLLSFAAAAHAEDTSATTTTTPTAGTVQVETAAVGTAVENRELTGSATEFDGSVTRVYCWTKVTASNPPAKVKHVWYAGDKNEAEVTLNINYPSARTWSSKNVWPGQWKVDVTDEAGSVLSSVQFTVKAAEAPAN